MERYESLGLVGEGSYGSVLKCRHRDSGRLVAIKKFVDSDDDKTVKKIALREIKLLRQLRHGNLVNLLEVWKRRRRWYLVFEFVERTLLDYLEHNPSGLDLNTSRQYLYQVLRATAFCHQQNIIHRDIKPENVLISQGGVVKLCDFGFARTLAGDVYTDYVATRWYRAPELLVGDIKYGKPVDVWAVGCLLLEMFTGQPLFPGDSDLDQIYHIIRCFGNLTAHHQELFYRNPVFSGVRLPECYGQVPLNQRFPTVTSAAVDLAQSCLQMDPERRAHCSELLEHPLFTQDSFHIRFSDELNAKIQKDHRENSNLPKISKTSRREKEERNEKNQRGKEKKQLEDVSEKVYREKEKKYKKEEEKTEKTKTRAKLSKTTQNTSETLTSNKQSRTFTGKVSENAVRASVAMKSKTGAGLRKELLKSEKTLTSISSKGSKAVTRLKVNNSVTEKPKHGKDASPEPREDCTDTPVSSEKTVMDICRSSKSKSGQEYEKKSWNNPNIKVPKMSRSSTTDHVSSSLRSFHQTALEAYQARSSDQTEVTPLNKPPATKPCKTPNSSEHQNYQLTTEREQTRTSECSKVLPSDPEPFNRTSNSGPEVNITNTSLSINLSEAHSPCLSSQSFTVFTEASPAHSTMTLPKGISNQNFYKTDLTSVANPPNDPTCAPNKPSQDLSKDKELVKVMNETKNQLGSFKTEVHKYLKTSPSKRAERNHSPITSSVPGKDQEDDPESSELCNVHQQSTSKSKIPSHTTLSEITKANTSVGTTIPKTLIISDKENREHLEVSVSFGNETSNVSGISINKQMHKSNEVECDVKSFRVPHFKSLIGQSQAKLWSSGNNTSTATVTVKTQKTTVFTETRKKSSPERNDSVSNISDSTSTSTLDHKASKRSFVLHNKDTADILHSSPPPPPSSTPLLLPPSSTTLIPSLFVINTNIRAVNDRLTLGNLSLRSMDETKHHGVVCSRLSQPSLTSHIPASLTTKASDKPLICERSFLTDRCNVHNSGDVVVAKKKSDVHFPDLSSWRGRDGQHNTVVTMETRTDSVSPSDRQQNRNNV